MYHGSAPLLHVTADIDLAAACQKVWEHTQAACVLVALMENVCSE